ncbi:MAG: YccF domain-containing protein [Alistipes sp.]|nr:YccF domain-containing protein [Alistipes sp.]
MNLFGNIVWLILGGWTIALEYMIAGALLCLTLIGIPFGLQSFKLGVLSLFPFGQHSLPVLEESGCLTTGMNILWFLVGGIWIVLTHLVLGVALCLTLIGIPFGRQHFKLMRLAISPFGRKIVIS